MYLVLTLMNKKYFHKLYLKKTKLYIYLQRWQIRQIHSNICKFCQFELTIISYDTALTRTIIPIFLTKCAHPHAKKSSENQAILPKLTPFELPKPHSKYSTNDPSTYTFLSLSFFSLLHSRLATNFPGRPTFGDRVGVSICTRTNRSFAAAAAGRPRRRRRPTAARRWISPYTCARVCQLLLLFSQDFASRL